MNQSLEQLQEAAEMMIQTNKSCKLSIIQAKMPFVEEDKFQKDQDTEKCTLCEFKFTLFKRRHHCRRCGFIMCGDCCPKRENTRFCFVCDYAMTSCKTALKSTLVDFLHSNPVKIFLSQKADFQQPLIVSQIYLTCGNLINDDEVRQKIMDNEELGLLMTNAIDFMTLLTKEQQESAGNVKSLTEGQKYEAIQNVLGMLINQSASNKKFFKPLGEIDYKTLIKFVSPKDNQPLLLNMLWVLNNLSENPKFIQTLLKIKEVKILLGKGLTSEQPQVYEKAISLLLQIFKYQLGKIKSAEMKIQESAASKKDVKISSDYSLDENIVTSVVKESIVKIISSNLQVGQSSDIRLYTLLGISQFIKVPKFAEQIMNVKKFDLFKAVAEIRKSVQQPRGQYIVYEFYNTIIELNEEQFNPYVLDKEIIKFIFNPELAKSGQRELLKLFFSQYSADLSEFLINNPKIVKFFKKSYKQKDIQACITILNNEEVTSLFVNCGFKLTESKVEGDQNKSKVSGSRSGKKTVDSDSSNNSDSDGSQNSDYSDESS